MLKSKFIIAASACALVIFLVSWRFPNQQTVKERVDAWLASSSKTPDDNLVNELRKEKYEGLNWLYAEYWKTELNYDSYRTKRKFLELFDRVAGQKDAISSKLFWYTDFNEALEEAKKQDKPLLCLQMLGDLREDFSCANSRFFRTLLYSNENISQIMREKYVLCWEPVIRVPKVTIEYPDGKKQVQTITGNSMHMIFDKEGKILDALPGLYGPASFQVWISQLSQPIYREHIDRLQKGRLSRLQDKTLNDMVNAEIWSNLLNEGNPYQKSPEKAIVASERSVAKAMSEAPLYSGLFTGNKKRFKQLPDGSGQNFKYSDFGFYWEKLPASIQKLIAAKKLYSEEDLLNTLKDLSNKLSIESVRNDVKIHSVILDWLQKRGNYSKKDFVNKVYRDLFLTPLDDKRMGLYDKSIFTATTDDGFLEGE